MQVKAEGGAVTPATELDASAGDVGHRFPRFLPDGKHFMYATIPAGENGHQTFLTALGAKDRTPIITSDGVPTFASPDRLVFRRNKTLYVQSFDPSTGRLAGEARPRRGRTGLRVHGLTVIERGGGASSPSFRQPTPGRSSFGSAPKAFKGTRCRFPPGNTPRFVSRRMEPEPPRPGSRRTIR